MGYPEGAMLLDPDEMEGLKHKHVTTRGELDHLEQANIQSGIQWLKKIRKKEILNEKFVRDLHRKLFGEVWKWAGVFRITEKNIGVDPREIAVSLRMLLNDVRYWIDNETYSLEEIAIRFESGYFPVVAYLLEQKYLLYINRDRLKTLSLCEEEQEGTCVLLSPV